MANDEISARIKIDGAKEAQKALADTGTAAKKLDGTDAKVKIEADDKKARQSIDDLMDKVDKLDGDSATIMLTANATQVGNEILDLITDLDKLDANDPQVDVKVGQIAALKGDLDTIEGKIKEVNSTPVDIDTKPAVKGLGDVGKSADSSKSVLANMVGNATQDLGALGGVAGSAGVAIGQMGEYMVDAANDGDKMKDVLRNFAAVAGPIALIAGAVQVATGYMADMAAKAEAADARVESFGDAMRTSADDAVGLTEALKNSTDELRHFDDEAGTFGGLVKEYLGDIGAQLPIVGGAFKDAGTDIIDIAQKGEISWYDLAAAIDAGGYAGSEFDQQLADLNAQGKITNAELETMLQFIWQYGGNAREAAAAQKLWNVDIDEANALLGELAAQEDPMGQFIDKWAILNKDLADGTINSQEAADAINFLADALGMTEAEVIALAQAKLDENLKKAQDEAWAFAKAMAEVSMNMEDAFDSSEAFATAIERINSTSSLNFGLMAQDTVASFDEVKTSLDDIENKSKIDWSNFDITPDEYSELKGMPEQLAAVTQAVEGMRGSIQTELQAAFDTGGIDAYTEKATFFRDQVLEQFPAKFMAMGASEEEAAAQTQALLGDLELLPEDVEIMIQLTREEEARNALDAFAGVIETMPDHVQVAINTAIAEGDVEKALGILNDQLIKKGYDPIVLPVDANTEPAEGTVDGFANGAQPDATVDLYANPREAEKTTDTFSKKKRATTPLDVDASTALAAGAILNFISQPRATTIYVGTSGLPEVSSALNSLDNPRTATITADANTTAAERELNNTARTRTATINVRTVGVFDAGGTVGPLGGIAGEGSGPEIINGRYLTMGPTYVPPGTKVTSTKRTREILHRTHLPRYANGSGAATPVLGNMTVNVNAAVIGNRFDVARAVSKASRDARRLQGSRR